MATTQIWTIDGEQFAPEPCAQELAHAEWHRPFSIAFFCPFCGDIWARRIVVDGHTEWALWTKPCSRHPHSISRGLSGSVWCAYETEYCKNLPVEILRREFLLHFDALTPKELTAS